MTLWAWIIGLFGARAVMQPTELPPPEQLTSKPARISAAAIDALRIGSKAKPRSPFLGIPTPPPGVRPKSAPPAKGMAMDAAGMAEDDALGAGGAWGAWATAGFWGEGLYFPGYPYLAELAQRPEYRHISETVAEEMTRKWIALISSGDDDKTDRIATLTDAMKRLGLREAFRRAFELDGFMGTGFIYINIDGVSDNPDELKAPLLIDKAKIKKGGLRGFVPVDPTWVSPLFYNSIDPLKPDFFVPSVWYVMGKQVHASRLLIIRSREIPDILKAGYNFGGLSLSQMAKPYVDNWLRARQSVSDLLHSFTVFLLKTTMGQYLQNAEQLQDRLSAFVLGRDNKGLFMVDKDAEDFGNVSAPLGTLDKLLAQAQEQMASVSKEPIIKLLGITPTGLNATTDGEIRVWYDHIRAEQEKHGHHVTKALELIQLSELGSIDPEIGYEFVALWELDDAGKAAVEKTKADTDAVFMANAVISNDEVRKRLAGDPQSPYHGLEGEAPEPEPPDIGGGGENEQDDPTGKIDKGGAEGSTTEANSGV